jgi:hypothetical protein
MALNDIIAKGVAVVHKVVKPLEVPILHAAYIQQNVFGSQTHNTPFGEPVSRVAILEQKQRFRQLSNGQMVLTYAHLIFTEPFAGHGAPGRKEPVDPRDKFILPDGTTGPVVDTDGLFNPATNSPYFLEVWLGGEVASSSR